MSQPNLHDFLLLYEKVGFYTSAILVGVYASLLESQEQTPVKVMPLSTPEATPIHPGIWSQCRQGEHVQRSMHKWELDLIQAITLHNLAEL